MGERSFKQRAQSGTRWGAIVVVSALAGSGGTFGALQLIQQHSLPVQTSKTSVPVTPVSTSTTTITLSDGITQVVKQDAGAVFPVLNYQQTSQSFFGSGSGSGSSNGSGSSTGQSQASDVGTSVLFKKDKNYGYLVTNHHVVEGSTKVEIVLASGKHVQAQIVGSDAYTDLAVLKIPVSAVTHITPIPFANSSSIQVGEPVVAIGTPMGLDFQDSVTSGIVSGQQRMMPVEDPNTQQILNYQPVIQTDAAINPGNSGGPLLDLHGDMIGINSSKIVDTSVQGMGFAIPSNTVAKIASQILQTGHAIHPALGIEGYSLSTVPERMWPNVPVNYGVYIYSVTSTEANAAGLKSGDVIVAIDGTQIKTMGDLRATLFQVSPGQKVTIELYRGNKKMTVTEQVGTLQTSP